MEKTPGDSLTKTPCRNLDGLFVSVSSLSKFSVLCFPESIAVAGVWGPHGGGSGGTRFAAKSLLDAPTPSQICCSQVIERAHGIETHNFLCLGRSRFACWDDESIKIGPTTN